MFIREERRTSGKPVLIWKSLGASLHLHLFIFLTETGRTQLFFCWKYDSSFRSLARYRRLQEEVRNITMSAR